MPFNFSARSGAELHTCKRDLQLVFHEVIKHWDCTILQGHRNQKEQDEAVRAGTSTLAWPTSNHNKMPSEAVDVAPYPINWEDAETFRAFGGFVLGVSTMMGIMLRWGGDWSMDRDFTNEGFIDLPHYELIVT